MNQDSCNTYRVIQKLVTSTILALLLSGMYSANCIAESVKAIDWNDASIRWHDFEAGLIEIQNGGKPGLLIFYEDACPVCRNYSKLFTDQEVVKSLQELVPIRVNQTTHPEVSKRYDLDGQYIPRTFALNSKGVLLKQLHSKDERFLYFLPADDPAALLRFMRSILEIGK